MIGVHLVAGAAEEQFLVFVHVCNLEFSSTFVAFEAILGDTQKMRNNDIKTLPIELHHKTIHEISGNDQFYMIQIIRLLTLW